MGFPLNRIVMYARDVEETVSFYVKHFGFEVHREEGDRIVELIATSGGANIMIHPAAKGLKVGQSIIKLVFDVEDVRAACAEFAKNGLDFGCIHHADGYEFANSKDPCQNSISLSSRAFRKSK